MILFGCHPTVSGRSNSHVCCNVKAPPNPLSKYSTRSLKTTTAGSFSPAAVAARATVKPFFSARVVFLRTADRKAVGGAGRGGAYKGAKIDP